MTLSKAVSSTADLILTKIGQELAIAQKAYFSAQVGVEPLTGRPTLRRQYEQTKPVAVSGVTYEVHEYDGPLGAGYILHAWVTEGKVQYHKQQDFGPEGRNQDWQEVIETV